MSDRPLDRAEALMRLRHDLKTPLAVMIGFAQVLQLELSDEDHQTDAAEIVSNGRKLQALIEEFAAIALADESPRSA